MSATDTELADEIVEQLQRCAPKRGDPRPDDFTVYLCERIAQRAGTSATLVYQGSCVVVRVGRFERVCEETSESPTFLRMVAARLATKCGESGAPVNPYGGMGDLEVGAAVLLLMHSNTPDVVCVTLEHPPARVP